MKQILRNGTMINQTTGQDRFLAVLYGSVGGRLLLKPLVHPVVSKLGGMLLSSGASRLLIRPFIRKHGIDMSQYEPVKYRNYNEFFSRRIRSGMRPPDPAPDHLISPCDSKLSVFPISSGSRFQIKHTSYSTASLLRNRELARRFDGGYLFLFRLTVDDYHRYCYVADGRKEKNVRVPGIFHTVNPIANDYYPIYKENTREYSILHTEEFGDLLMMEVGALLVGKIVNHHEAAKVRRGREKGFFQFGGSTVILMTEPGSVMPDTDLLANTKAGMETVVKMGDRIGIAGRANDKPQEKRYNYLEKAEEKGAEV